MFASRRVVSCVRTFATATPAAAKSSHVPPIKIHGIVGRYASAVYTAASKINALERVENELNAFNDLVNKNQNFAAFLENPTIPRAEKVAKIGDLYDEKTFSHISRNLMITMCANGKISDANKVISAFNEIMQASRGAVKVTIISADPLKKAQLEQIQKNVVSLVGAGKTAEVVAEVNPDILGGLQVMIGDKFLDLSVSSRVADLSKTLESARA